MTTSKQSPMPYRSMPRRSRASSPRLFDDSSALRDFPEHHLVAHIDGGARGNPGPAGYGVAIQDQAGRSVAELSEYLGKQTNNYAEYSGLLAALTYAIKHGFKGLKVFSDSELMVKQIKGQYKVKNPALQELHGKATRMIRELDSFEIRHVLREKNRDADRLANEAMDRGMNRSVPVSSASGPANPIPEREVSGIVK